MESTANCKAPAPSHAPAAEIAVLRAQCDALWRELTRLNRRVTETEALGRQLRGLVTVDDAGQITVWARSLVVHDHDGKARGIFGCAISGPYLHMLNERQTPQLRLDLDEGAGASIVHSNAQDVHEVRIVAAPDAAEPAAHDP